MSDRYIEKRHFEELRRNLKAAQKTNAALRRQIRGENITRTTNPLTGGDVDQNAIHDNVVAEISAMTNKATPVGADYILIEDSADGDSKKYITITQLEAILSLANLAVRAHSDLSDAPASAHHVKYTNAEAVDAIEAVLAAGLVGADSVVFVDATDGVLKQDTFTNILNNIIHPWIAGEYGKGTLAESGDVDLTNLHLAIIDTTNGGIKKLNSVYIDDSSRSEDDVLAWAAANNRFEPKALNHHTKYTDAEAVTALETNWGS